MVSVEFLFESLFLFFINSAGTFQQVVQVFSVYAKTLTSPNYMNKGLGYRKKNEKNNWIVFKCSIFKKFNVMVIVYN